MFSPTDAISDDLAVGGYLYPIPGLPEPREKPLFNAENLTFSEEGRLFVTGSLAVYEIARNRSKAN